MFVYNRRGTNIRIYEKEDAKGKRKERDAVVFLNEHLKVLSRVFLESERGRMIEYLRAYSIEGKMPDLTPMW